MLPEVLDFATTENTPGKTDRLLNELDKVERQLQQWIAASEKNARLFREDPLGAMRAAGLNMEDDTMLELEMIMKSLAKKLK